MPALFVYCPRSQRAIKQKISLWSTLKRLHTLSGVSANKNNLVTAKKKRITKKVPRRKVSRERFKLFNHPLIGHSNWERWLDPHLASQPCNQAGGLTHVDKGSVPPSTSFWKHWLTYKQLYNRHSQLQKFCWIKFDISWLPAWYSSSPRNILGKCWLTWSNLTAGTFLENQAFWISIRDEIFLQVEAL